MVGVCLLIIAAIVPKLAVPWDAVVVGVILAFLATVGHAVGGRRHYR